MNQEITGKPSIEKNGTTNQISHQHAINLAIQAVVQQFGGTENSDQIVKYLKALENFELNAMAISLAFMEIRSLACDCFLLQEKNEITLQEAMRSIKEIEKISDNLHNVATFIAKGKLCNAMVLLRFGSGKYGSTGVDKT